MPPGEIGLEGRRKTEIISHLYGFPGQQHGDRQEEWNPLPSISLSAAASLATGLLFACLLPAEALHSDALAAPASARHGSLEACRISGLLDTPVIGGSELRTPHALNCSVLTTD